MKMTGAQILLDGLMKENVDTVFGILGGAVLPLYDTLPQFPQIHHVLVRHEQCAAHAAEGYARASGKVGVCFATSGPGATNLVTGIANAYLDSTPMVAVTGQVARRFIGKDAFQEVDITGITLPITKHNYLVREAGALAKTVKEAFYIARTGRPGPVLIDVPKDVFTEEVEYHAPGKVDLSSYKFTMKGHPAQIQKAAAMINAAQKPVIIAGRGVIISQAFAELKELAEKAQIPVVTTLLGLGSFPESHVLSYRWLGMHGMGSANLAVNNADVIIAIGMRFDDRATSEVNTFAPNAKIIHIDIDPAEIGKNVSVDVPIVGDVKSVLGPLNKAVNEAQHGEWLQQLDAWRRQHPHHTHREGSSVLPEYVIHQLWEATKGEATIVTGVGQHQMWAAQLIRFNHPRLWINSGGLGSMGFGLPAAMGAQFANPDKLVFAIVGDGGFQMSIPELATISGNGLPVKIVVMNNGYLGMVRQWQTMFYNNRLSGVELDCFPDVEKLAGAYGFKGRVVDQPSQLAAALEAAVAEPGPYLLNVKVTATESVYPMVAAGAAIHEMVLGPPQPVPVPAK